MFKNLINNYINNLSKNDIKYFCNKKKININDSELDIVYIYLKKYYKDILINPNPIFNSLKDKISPYLYNEVIKYYNMYSCYKKYL